MNEEVFQCFHTDIMNKYIFPVQQKISGNFPENFLEIFRNIFFRKSYITAPVTICHTPRDPPKVRHPIFIRPSTKTPDNNPLYKFSLSCSWGVLSEGL